MKTIWFVLLFGYLAWLICANLKDINRHVKKERIWTTYRWDTNLNNWTTNK